MNNNYSKAMKKIMKPPSSIFLTHLIFLLSIAILIGIAVNDYITEKRKFEDIKNGTALELFDPFNEELEYGQITPLFMSEEFASNYDDSIYYCFLMDEQYYSYIVAINADELDKFEDIIEYTYYDVEEPELVTLKGKSVLIESDLTSNAIDAYNVFMGTVNVNEDNISDHLGFYYLDTTEQPHIDYSVTVVCLVIAATIGMFYINAIYLLSKALKRRRETLATNNYILEEVDKEISREDTVYIKSHILYITKNYIVSYFGGFDIIPIDNIIHVYGAYKGNNRITSNALAAIVETQDGVQHEIACMKSDRKLNKLKDILVEEIKRRKPDVEIGHDGRFLPLTKTDRKIAVDTKDDYSEVTSNVFLGIIGAILGATIGGIVWLLLSIIGYIAGIAGYLMMYLAIRGYRKFSGFLDKKGQVISIVIVLLMIFFANYLSSALVYCSYTNSGYSIGDIMNAFINIPNYLTKIDGWGDFLLNLLIGYGLFIWSASKILKSIIKKDR